jgi:hypothetical protein
MELFRTKLIQELRDAREDLFNINFATDTPRIVGVLGVSNPYALVEEWLQRWDATFRKSNTLGHGMVNIRSAVATMIDGSQQESDPEVFNELRPVFVGYIHMGLSILDQEYELETVLEAYIKRVKDTKLAMLLNEFNAVKDIAPNIEAIGFRTILGLILQEKAKRVNPTSNTAIANDLAPGPMIDRARNDHILSIDEQSLVDSFQATHKDIYNTVAHRPGAKNLVDKSEVNTMIDLLNKLLPSIIN